MKYIATAFVLILALASVSMAQEARVSWTYQAPLISADSVMNGLQSIRGVAYGNDIDGDGRREIAVTNYNQNGYVHIFEVQQNDSLKLVWTSPRIATLGGISTPRYVTFGDMDNDGRGEVIFQSNGNGIYFFEWNGVVGQDVYGTTYSALIPQNSTMIQNAVGNCEYFEVGDIDGDNVNELTVAYNASSNATDIYYIFSAVGNWSTNDPGFSTFTKEYEGVRTNLVKWGISGGSPWAMIAAQLDGTGRKEIIVHNWNKKNVVPMRVTAANTYALSDTTTTKYQFYLGGANDDVALFGGIAYDIDADGRDEVYLPTYQGRGTLHMISYNGTESTSIIDSVNVTSLASALSSFGATRGYLGISAGDMDKDGKKDIYLTSTPPYNVVALEFQGGDKRVASNWTSRVLYKGDTTIVDAMTIRDSSTVSDTTRTYNTAFVAKINAKATDLDKDGFEDIIMPFQAFADSISVTKRTWNSTTSRYDTTKYKLLNPRRPGLRVLEGNINTGVEAKEWTLITPADYILEQNYPNPFNPTTTIRFRLPVVERVSVKVFDLAGREIRTLINNEERPAGTSEVVWDGRTSAGTPAASGVYFYTLSWGNFYKTQKMTLVK